MNASRYRLLLLPATVGRPRKTGRSQVCSQTRQAEAAVPEFQDERHFGRHVNKGSDKRD